jgi:hypothetical protein
MIRQQLVDIYAQWMLEFAGKFLGNFHDSLIGGWFELVCWDFDGL